MEVFNTQQLEKFLKEALKHCYLGEFKRAETIERKGFFEMEYDQDDWSYRDSFAGFYISTGQEIIRYKGRPIWSSNYGGGLKEKHFGNMELFTKVEKFLRESLSKADQNSYSPRGPEEYTQGEFRYECKWEGDITSFHGIEQIYLKDEEVFYHRFFGGIIYGIISDYSLSYLMGADAITEADLEKLDIKVVEVLDSGSRKLLVPKYRVNEYKSLLKSKLSAGFWNEIVSEDEILFIFKSKDGDVEEIAYSEKDKMKIAKLCSEYSGDPVEKTSDLLHYLAGNDFYKDFIKRFYLK